MNDALIKKTQSIFREVNERIAQIALGHGEDESGFLCECGRADCVETIVIPLLDYQALREGAFFIAARDHGVAGVDRLVESRDGFDVLVQA